MKAIALSVLALLAGTAGAMATDYPLTLTDVAGHTVTIEKKPERIILQDGRDMLTMALLDRDNPYKRVVGWSSNFVKSDPGSAKLMDQAFGKAPPVMSLSEDGEVDLEAIIAAKPDIVVAQLRAQKAFQQGGVEDKLKSVGIAVVYLDLMEKPVEGALKSVEVLGKAIDREKEAAEYISFYTKHLDHLNEVIAKQTSHPNVFVEAKAGNKGDGCCFTHGDTGFGKLVAALKGNNLGTKLLPGQTGNVSLETLLSSNPPDVYIMSGSQWTNPENAAVPFGYNVTPQQVSAALGKLEQRDGFPAMKAVQDGRVYGIYHQFYNHPYNIVGLEYFATFMYPDAFKDLKPAETYATLIKDFTKIPDAPVVLGASAPVSQ
ncbi:ABC transporter substrate-binding protein [Neorhizobium alkalisoli]|uniref:Iron complex transport system substrate-binding protein n=1 Tax=Neorhizobium alkalisoli TaxID=528178 RepID=A0A561QNV5_9HYPH|nr:ABC transporter substrate-binding protein [Neorhizobium alkalisoli]TWF52063.1 iron complex transport system substrate-binding protein [Neorhizobium alkalisoli]